jgi:hypothetical protein
LLCQTGKVYDIESHLTPAGITKNTYGKRNYEEIYTIDPSTKKIETYYGRNHPQKIIQEIKTPPNSRKGIFCKKCEDNLGNYETAVHPVMNKIFDTLGKGGYKVIRTTKNNKSLKINLNRNVLGTYYLSVVWRQCIEQLMDNKDSPLNFVELEILRLNLLSNIEIKIVEIIKKDTLPEIRIILATTYFNDTSIIGTYANPHLTMSNPQLFFIGPSLLLYWKEEKESSNIKNVLNKAIDIIDTELNLEHELIAILSTDQWHSITYPFIKIAKNQFVRE